MCIRFLAVNSILDSIKKFGTYALLALLVIIMGGYAFVDQTATDAARQSIMSGTGPGSYGDHDISWSLYSFYYSNCKEQQARFESQFGEFDKSNPMFSRFSAENCVKRTFTSLFSLHDIGTELTLKVTTESIKNDIAKQAIEAAAQQQVIHEDEKLSAQEIYRRLLNQIPFDARKLEKIARYSQALISAPISVPTEVLAQKNLSEQVDLEMTIVRFDNTALIESFKEAAVISEDEINKQYQEEQAKLKDDQKKPLQEEKPFLIERMKAEKARKKMGEIKQKLSDLKSGFDLQDVSKITGVDAQVVKSVSLDKLAEIPLPNGKLNLNQTSFYKSMQIPFKNAYTSGPHQDTGFTVYVRVDNVTTSASNSQIVPDKIEEERVAEQLGKELSNELLEAISRNKQLKLDIQDPDQG